MSSERELIIDPCLLGEVDSPYAIISDIHSNLAALEAVLEDIDSQGIPRICCLGDVVGYGPQPMECWDLVRRRCKIIIRGNHDQALSADGIGRFHPRARAAIEWTRARLLQDEDGESIVDILSTLPTHFRCQGRLYVHGSPRGKTMDYLLPRDSFDRERMDREFREVEVCAFNGHTHIPGVVEKGEAFRIPESIPDACYIIGDMPAIINVGSVGQPRDGNPKACYVVVDENRVQYRRVEYDVELTCGLILGIPSLDPFLGYRLIEGR